jgi:hypothetical protein
MPSVPSNLRSLPGFPPMPRGACHITVSIAISFFLAASSKL